MRFEEFKKTLVQVVYGKDEKQITGELIFEDNLIIKIKTLSQTVAIGVESIITLQPKRNGKDMREGEWTKQYRGLIEDEIPR